MRGQTRVNLGLAFNHWQELSEIEGCETDAEPAFLLLDKKVTLAGLQGLVLLHLLGGCVSKVAASF